MLDTPRGCALRPVRSHRRTARGDAALTETLHSVGSEDRAADQELVFEAGVVATELLSNATQACRSRIAVRLEVHHGSIRIEVYDDGPGVPVERRARADERRPRTADRRSLSASWGTIPRPAGKCVWSEMPVVSSLRQPGLHLPPRQSAASRCDRAGERSDGLRRVVAITLTSAANVVQCGTAGLSAP